MGDGSLVAPLRQAPHDLAMNSRQHISLHGLLGVPDRAGPKRIVGVAEDGNNETPFSGLGLLRRAESLDEKRRKVTPRSHPQAREGNEEHVYSILNLNQNASSPSN
jgi:hypothetical protein